MKPIAQIAFALACSILIFACSTKTSTTEADNLIFGKDISSIDSSEVRANFKRIIEALKPGEVYQAEQTSIYATGMITDIYIRSGFNGIWTQKAHINDALKLINDAEEVGLFPRDYHLREINALIDTLSNSPSLDPLLIAALDLMLSDAIVTLFYHHVDGKVSPYKLDQNWNFSKAEVPDNVGELFSTSIKNGSLTKDFNSILEKHPFLDALRVNLSKYRSIKANGGWESIEGFDGKLEKGDTSRHVPGIYARLKATGDVGERDSAANPLLYGEQLETAVKKFQYRHLLNEDGIIGKSVINAMNIPVEEKIKQIQLNMERTRWVDYEPKYNVIFVNIARFHLFLAKGAEVQFDTKVMTGKPYHSTPIFLSKLAYIEFNPTWTVPRSILRNELIPRILKDPAGYLNPRNMELLTMGGQPVNPASIDPNKYSVNNFPFMVRQKPGPKNALGEVKFIFPNKFSVYLHDTPSKYLFARESRAFSHGCIRVQNPLDFAHVLLNDEDKWSKANINKVVQTRKITRATPKEDYYVAILYLTASVDDDGNALFMQDVYSRDEKVWKNLSGPMDLEYGSFPSEFIGLTLDTVNSE